MKSELFSIDDRLRIIERYLFFLTLLVFSMSNLINQKELKISDYGIFLNILVFFVSFCFVIYDFVFFIVSFSRQFGDKLENFIIRNRTWITYPIIAIIILTAILIVRFYFGIEWKTILPPILPGLIILLITQAQKISSWIKQKLEP